MSACFEPGKQALKLLNVFYSLQLFAREHFVKRLSWKVFVAGQRKQIHRFWCCYIAGILLHIRQRDKPLIHLYDVTCLRYVFIKRHVSFFKNVHEVKKFVPELFCGFAFDFLCYLFRSSFYGFCYLPERRISVVANEPFLPARRRQFAEFCYNVAKRTLSQLSCKLSVKLALKRLVYAALESVAFWEQVNKLFLFLVLFRFNGKYYAAFHKIRGNCFFGDVCIAKLCKNASYTALQPAYVFSCPDRFCRIYFRQLKNAFVWIVAFNESYAADFFWHY